MAGLIRAEDYVVASVTHDNVPTVGESHDARDCPGPDECRVARDWLRVRELTRGA